jgi:acyl dehydratase
MPGKYFDEWAVGETTDNLLWSTMTHNTQPLHIDAEFARASEFGQILVNGTFTFSLMIGVTVAETTMGVLVANLGYDKVVMPKPVFIGDTLHASSEVIELRDSKSRPNAGLVTWKHRMINQRGDVVCECLRTALLLRKAG